MNTKQKALSVLLSLAMSLTLVVAAPFTVSAEQNSLDDHLISHWNFVGEGADALADKAPCGSSSDTMVLSDSTVTVSDGKVKIPDWKNQNSNHYIYANDSADLLRTTESRTIYILFESTHVAFTTDKNDRMELATQNGALRLGIKNTNELFGTTNSHWMTENTCDTSGMNTYVPNTPITVAISYLKDTSSTFTITTCFKVGDGNWITSTVTKTDAEQTWTQDDSDPGQSDPMYLCFGRRSNNSASTWGGDISIDDIRIYNIALTADEIASINVNNDKVTSAGHSLTLSGEIGVNFYLNVDRAYSDANVTVKNGEKELFSAVIGSIAEESNGSRKITALVNAKQMTDQLTLTVFRNETTLYTENYSVHDYTNYILTHTAEYDAELVTLVKAMLNYGGFAQTQFGYHTNNMANAGLNIVPNTIEVTEQYKQVITGDAASLGLTDVKASLSLQSKTCVVFQFTVEGNVADYTIEGGEVTVEGNKITVITEGICIQNLNTAKLLSVSRGDLEFTLSYSPMTYVMNMAGNAEVAELLKALNDYSVAARAYLN